MTSATQVQTLLIFMLVRVAPFHANSGSLRGTFRATCNMHATCIRLEITPSPRLHSGQQPLPVTTDGQPTCANRLSGSAKKTLAFLTATPW